MTGLMFTNGVQLRNNLFEYAINNLVMDVIRPLLSIYIINPEFNYIHFTPPIQTLNIYLREIPLTDVYKIQK